jgi:hypothetical protein
LTDRAPRPIVKLIGGKLSPVSSWDAELLADLPNGTEFDLVRRSKRSRPHNSMYFAQLSLIIKATGEWPTPDHMHEWIKLRLGYVRPILGQGGKVVGMTVDSAAFDKMDQAAFGVFYEKACALIAAEMGIDMADVVPGWSI